jgi:hypothetical protein
MSKFEWMELETLSSEIARLQSRLDAASATKNYGLIRLLRREIAEMAERRARVLAAITNGLGFSASAGAKPSPAPVQQIEPKQIERQPALAEQVEAPSATGLTSSEPVPVADSTEGVCVVWDRVTAADIERVKRGLASRRSEMLARHAEELKGLDADQTEIDTIEQAINVFSRRFKLSAEVVPFAGERSAQTEELTA